MFRTGDVFAAKIVEGGLFSFDNMHLSSVGYEVMALAFRMAMARAGDPRLGPPLTVSPDPCKSKGEGGFDNMKVGDCINLLSTPGWAFADATRRSFVFQRMVGQREMDTQDFVKAISAFVAGLQ